MLKVIISWYNIFMKLSSFCAKWIYMNGQRHSTSCQEWLWTASKRLWTVAVFHWICIPALAQTVWEFLWTMKVWKKVEKTNKHWFMTSYNAYDHWLTFKLNIILSLLSSWSSPKNALSNVYLHWNLQTLFTKRQMF